MSKCKAVKVLGAGSPILDLLVKVEEAYLARISGTKGGMELVSPSQLEEILAGAGAEPVLAPGGSAANTVFGLAQLGLPTALLGKLGRDKNGEFYQARYQSVNGDLSRFKYHESLPSGRCLSLVTPDRERTMRTDLGAAATLAPEDLAPADFAGVTHVHLEGYLLFNAALVRAILSGAKAAGCTVSLDLASFEVVRATMKILKEILGRYIDIVFANEDEAAAFAGGAGPREALAVLGKICPTAVVKIGREGAWLQHGGETVQVAAERVEAVDTTGAGDLWQAGFLYGFLQGRPLAQCGRYGAILGAEVVQIMGAAIPAERWPEIRRRVKQP